MGYLMARNLARHLASQPTGASALLVYNRTVKKAEQLVAEVGTDKVKIAASPGQLATECDVVITNLASDAVVKSIYEEFAKALAVRCSRCSTRLLLAHSVQSKHPRQRQKFSSK
jgi:3-hydroxyisobutyrate dehydrogenase-like beta-hydroxyacid dehydrogenase